MATVTLYTKPDCSLCGEARATILRVRRELAFDLEEVDISGDPVLHEKYAERVPVVLVDGAHAFDLWVQEAELKLRVSRSADSGASTATLRSAR